MHWRSFAKKDYSKLHSLFNKYVVQVGICELTGTGNCRWTSELYIIPREAKTKIQSINNISNIAIESVLGNIISNSERSVALGIDISDRTCQDDPIMELTVSWSDAVSWSDVSAQTTIQLLVCTSSLRDHIESFSTLTGQLASGRLNAHREIWVCNYFRIYKLPYFLNSSPHLNRKYMKLMGKGFSSRICW